MNLLDIYELVDWHQNNRDKPPGESVGLFIPLPRDLASQYPPKGEGRDSSPPHVTLLYCGTVPGHMENKMEEVCREACSSFKSFSVKIKKPRKFVNDKNETIRHSPVASIRLKRFHDYMKEAFIQAGLPVSDKYPEFKPHITIEYVAEGEKSQYKDIKPQGIFEVEEVHLWGTTQPYVFKLK